MVDFKVLLYFANLIVFLRNFCHTWHCINWNDPCFAESLADKTAGASSLECLSSIVDRLSSVESGPAALRDTTTFSPSSSDSQPCTPESPGSRPVYHVLWRKLWRGCIAPHTNQQLRLQQEMRTGLVQNLKGVQLYLRTGGKQLLYCTWDCK